MKSLIEKIFKREQVNVNYVIGEYKPSHGKAMSKPSRTSITSRTSEYNVESASAKDEMEIDNIYQEK